MALGRIDNLSKMLWAVQKSCFLRPENGANPSCTCATLQCAAVARARRHSPQAARRRRPSRPRQQRRPPQPRRPRLFSATRPLPRGTWLCATATLPSTSLAAADSSPLCRTATPLVPCPGDRKTGARFFHRPRRIECIFVVEFPN